MGSSELKLLLMWHSLMGLDVDFLSIRMLDCSGTGKLK